MKQLKMILWLYVLMPLFWVPFLCLGAGILTEANDMVCKYVFHATPHHYNSGADQEEDEVNAGE